MADIPPQQPGGVTLPVLFQPGPARVDVDKCLVNGQNGYLLRVWTPGSTSVTFWDEPSYRTMVDNLRAPLLDTIEVANVGNVTNLFGPHGGSA